jgi:hypothetical protein
LSTGSYDTDAIRGLATSLRRTSGELHDTAATLTRGGLPYLHPSVLHGLETLGKNGGRLIGEVADSTEQTAAALDQAAQRYDGLDQAIIACMSF